LSPDLRRVRRGWWLCGTACQALLWGRGYWDMQHHKSGVCEISWRRSGH
jgi:hypothetical protein